jgi:hypothetical protein
MIKIPAPCKLASPPQQNRDASASPTLDAGDPSRIMPEDELISLNYAMQLPIYEYEKPYQIVSEFAGEHKTTNLEFELAAPEVIQDVRGREHMYSLDSCGFQVIRYDPPPGAPVDWPDKHAIESQYLPQVKQLLTEHVDGADEVFLFNWRVCMESPCQDKGTHHNYLPTPTLRSVNSNRIGD